MQDFFSGMRWGLVGLKAKGLGTKVKNKNLLEGLYMHLYHESHYLDVYSGD